MVSKKYTIKNEEGLHARPASDFCKAAGKFKSDITLIKDGEEFEAKSILMVLCAGAQCGDEIKLREKSQKNVMFKENFESNILNVLPYLSKDEANFSGVLQRYPERTEVPIEINEVLVVEYYSKN